MIKRLTYAALAGAMLLCSCSKDDEEKILPVEINSIAGLPSTDGETPVTFVNAELKLTPSVANDEGATYAWLVDGAPVATTKELAYHFEKNGQHTIKLLIKNRAGEEASKEIKVDVFRPVTDKTSKWISELFDFVPAPGQFINKAPGDLKSAQSIIGKRGMVSLGSFGGYIVFGFDHTVLNNEGADFVIHGNAFDGNSEAGAVQVSYDANGNGKPDDEWYELVGSEHSNALTVKDYEITYLRPSQTTSAEDVKWTDNKGGSGALHSGPISTFHQQSYWPLFIPGAPEKLTFKGTKLRNLAQNRSEEEGTEFWYNAAAEWGYADNFSKDYKEIATNGDRDTQYSNKFDLVNAIDKNGKPVKLRGIDFVKVYSCLNQEAGWLGEASTEVCGAISLTPKITK